MEHNDIRYKLSEYLDGSLTEHEKQEIDEHLKTCSDCSKALEELRKTIEQIKAIEKIEPPAWMTQKIMANVRTEAEKEKSIFRKLFFPLSTKLPLQAVAAVFLVVTAFYLYQSIHPSQRIEEAPTASVILKEEAKQSSPAKDKLQSDAQDIRSFAAPAKAARPAESEQKEMIPESKTPAPRMQAKTMMKDEAVSASGAAVRSKAAKMESPSSLRKTNEYADKMDVTPRFERIITERHHNSQPKLVVTYEILNSKKIKIAEERFNAEGIRHGIQKEFYPSGQVKTEAEYGNGRLEWYQEYEQNGLKKTEKSDFDWLWLKSKR
ncbi:MAG: DUF2275 domain-containing protein [Nitrospirota bacterium]